jgi:hypothetical protein
MTCQSKTGSLEENQMGDATKGAFNIGSVGGNFSVSAGGDVVAGDKVTTATSTTTITNGFKEEEDKQQFVRDIEGLGSAPRELRAKLQEAVGVSQNDKDKIVAEVLQQVIALKAAKEEASSLPEIVTRRSFPRHMDCADGPVRCRSD